MSAAPLATIGVRAVGWGGHWVGLPVLVAWCSRCRNRRAEVEEGSIARTAGVVHRYKSRMEGTRLR